MRALVVSIWVFIHLVFFGMCGYMYLLWSQYWMYMESQESTTIKNYDQQIYLYNRGLLTNNTHHKMYDVKNRTKHSVNKHSVNITYVKNSRPRFPNLQMDENLLDNNKYVCRNNKGCINKTKEFKIKIINELKRVFLDESNVFKSGLDVHNPYNVNYKGARGNYLNKDAQQMQQMKPQIPHVYLRHKIKEFFQCLVKKFKIYENTERNRQESQEYFVDNNNIMCELKEIDFRTIRRNDEPFVRYDIKNFIPKRKLFENKHFNTCAIISSAGALRGSNLGKLIDSHDLVLRFNNAPTNGYENDVGTKTTIRVLNSQVIYKDEFNFTTSGIYKNVTLVVWDPSNYTSNLDEWYHNPDYKFFDKYVQYRKNNNNNNGRSKSYLLNPISLWKVWDFLQINSPNRIRRNPPSSGFLGLVLLLPHCDYVDFFEYVPSVRVTSRCHYYDNRNNSACTFGVWHPLAAEKLLAYHLNKANDIEVFQRGYVRIPGFNIVKCT